MSWSIVQFSTSDTGQNLTLALLAERLVVIRMGKVTKEMLNVPKPSFVIIGLCEALASLLLLICTARLPGVILPVLQQLLIIWQMIISAFLLGKRSSLDNSQLDI